MIYSSEYRCPQRPQENIGFPEAIIRVVNCLTQALGMNLGPLQVHAFNSETPLHPSPILTFKPRAIWTEDLTVEAVLRSEKTHRGGFLNLCAGVREPDINGAIRLGGGRSGPQFWFAATFDAIIDKSLSSFGFQFFISVSEEKKFCVTP